MQIKSNAKPFMKWAGGKGQLLRQLDEYLPQRLQTEQFTYIEPFVGGGAMFFHILQKFPNIKEAVINDVNADLIKAYRVIKDNPEKLIEKLKKLESDYLSLDEANRKEMFLNERSAFNRHDADDVDNTVLLLFLNKTCFNGLFRVNRKGDFNVPFGKYKNPVICNAEVLMADSKVLNGIMLEITVGDFTDTSRFIDNSGLTFFYFDPPYRPLSETSSFTSYSIGDFNDDDQRRLATFCQDISSDNCLWMLSNSDCGAKNPEDTFFEELYQNYKIEKVYASRSINANADKRGKLTELLIHNQYNITKKLLFKMNTVQHTKENFETFLGELAETNATLPYYCDFKKVDNNVQKVKMRLSQLNYLIGQKDMASAVKTLWNENPKVFSVLDILIAVRKRDKKKAINDNGNIVLIESYFESVEGVLTYLKETGLQEVLQSNHIKNLVDYVFGVEVGLDTNARKNRGGIISKARLLPSFLRTTFPSKGKSILMNINY